MMSNAAKERAPARRLGIRGNVSRLQARMRRSSQTTPRSNVSEARRAAGLTEKDLATRLEVSLWEMERIERGQADLTPYLPQLEEETGSSRVRLVPEQPREKEAELATEPQPPRAGDRRGALWLVLGSIAALVLVRFFTEVLPVLPRAANFIDVLIVVALALAAAINPAARGVSSRPPPWLMQLAAVFVLLSVVATVTNLSRVELGPALVFLYGILSPLLVYVSVFRLWPPGNCLPVSRLLIGLGVVQLLVVGLVQVPQYGIGGNPDKFSGTFGTNTYQFAFFMMLFIAVLATVYTRERGRLAARFAPLLIGLAFLAIIIAQYRSLYFTTALTILMLAAILGWSGARGWLVSAGVAVAFAFSLFLGAQYIPGLKVEQAVQMNPVNLAGQRLQVLDQLDSLYSDTPRFALTGTGPGTYSSRGWQTFAKSESKSASNVAGSYALTFTGGAVYHTDVSDEYVLPLAKYTKPVSGSYALNQPYTEYVSVAAEVGLLGLLTLFCIYGGAFISASRRSVAVLRDHGEGDSLAVIVVPSMVGFFILLQLGALENWLEVTRLTFIAWILLAIGTKEHAARQMPVFHEKGD